ncbi:MULTISPECIES: hypothetical protein [unclassified Sporosarcina]|uniref:hypothetical protein n=1 Tax=unclassified Sporosarcina TaxID=2647733 RepID=UPI000C16BEFB|nr:MULTISPECIES: hypothetical protein [unclassified Sporosarcina]PID05396.1 hypothetical protein CSV66_10165 [Sporosarcina sp. P30]PID08591.1 hypothetical protein CSV65_10165 [Sporosarcina sp. P31]PID11593.1 hypothetical protein CSV64_11130 [Sporosarcina sp. P32b]
MEAEVGATPDGSARKERQPKESAANWLAHREPMGKRPPTGASIPNHSHSTLTPELELELELALALALVLVLVLVLELESE